MLVSMAADRDEIQTRLQRARELLRRIREASREDQDGIVSLYASTTAIGLSYLEARAVLAALLEQRWVVRHDRDGVSLTPLGAVEANRAD